MNTPSYYQLIGRRSSIGMRAMALEGGKPGIAPLGYTNCRYGKLAWAEIDPMTAPPVREAFCFAAEGKYSLRKIIEKMTARGLRSRGGKVLTSSSMYYLLTNPFYVGFIKFKGELHPGAHTSIIDQACFDRVQRKLRERRKSGGVRRS